MPRFSPASLQSKPWLWRYDSRRLRGCQYEGHSYRWFHYKLQTHHYYNGLCRRCDQISSFEVCESQHSFSIKALKQFFKVVKKEITQEESDRMLAEHQAFRPKRGRPTKSTVGLDLRRKRSVRVVSSDTGEKGISVG